MFSNKVLDLSNKINNLDSLKRNEISILIKELEAILLEHQEIFENELDQRNILNKILFLNYHLIDPMKIISEFQIEEKHIVLKLKNDKQKKIKIKKIQPLVEMYFFIQPKDDLYKALCLYFFIPDNFLKLHLYDSLT